jgi:hypothetical protein
MATCCAGCKVRSRSNARVPLSKCTNVDAARRNASPYPTTGNRCSLALSELLRERILSCVRFVFENQCSIQSAHFSTWPSVPHGITGTDEVEFFGEPSISLSEYTM